jgi:hypothetical protein
LKEVARFYCSELSRRAAESTFGTASIGTVWLLLEYPHGWGPHALQDSALPNHVKDYFSRTFADIRHSRLLFIKTDRGRTDARMNFFVVRCREQSPFIVRFKLEKYDDVTALDLASVVSRKDLQGGVVTEKPFYLVCTHGKRDKCCAKFGIPLFNNLREIAGDAVWQSSHVGGDRFAGNLVCFPHGLFYAHATEETGRKIVGGYNARQMVLDKFRGRACYSHQVQAAEFFARCEAGINGVEDLRFITSRREAKASWLVRFADSDGRIHHVSVGRRQSEVANFTTCNSVEKKAVSQFFLEGLRVEQS